MWLPPCIQLPVPGGLPTLPDRDAIEQCLRHGVIGCTAAAKGKWYKRWNKPLKTLGGQPATVSQVLLQ